MEWWKLGLEYLKVIVGWPLIVLALAIVLRKQLSSLLRRDLEAEAAGVRVRVGRAEEAAEVALEEATQVTASDIESQPGNVCIEDEDEDRNSSDLQHEIALPEQPQVSLGEEQARRVALERVLSEGARLGWEWARTGENEPPKLTVYWSDGIPRVSTEGNSQSFLTRNYSGMSADAYVRRVFRLLFREYRGLVLRTLPDSEVDATIMIRDHRIGVVIKYVHPNARISSPAMHRMANSAMYLNYSRIIIISNSDIARSAQEMLQKSVSKISWIKWSDFLDEDGLVDAINDVINDVQRRAF